MSTTTTTTQYEYRVSQRVLIQVGDRFRAKGGPQWRLADGTKVSLSSKGPYTFIASRTRGACVWVEAFDRSGNFCVLHISGRRKKISDAAINRPYTIIGKKRQQKKNDGGSLAEKSKTATVACLGTKTSSRRMRHGTAK